MTDDRNITGLLLNQTFKLFRCNTTLTPTTTKLSHRQLERFRISLSKFLYRKYRESLKYNDELITRYETYRDIITDITIYNGTVHKSDNRIQYLILKSSNKTLLARHVIIFVSNTTSNNESSIVLNKITSQPDVNDYIIELLEDINDSPLLIKPFSFPRDFIPNLVNQLSTHVAEVGHMQLVYSPPLGNSTLRNFIIDIPKADTEKLFNENLYNDICQFLYNTSKVKFDKIQVDKFMCHLLNVSQDGRFKLNDDVQEELVWSLVESIRGKTL
ncbi:uncharacterized protein SPAPADRAFT_62389 [Spathaspora passalidarum NRRL Y-27907]|uniref:Uncharacterized protein n=1 Tax=Spathaspora passalidarum (strain NRRL Y-27907 / 11-Y1) TaxID=619300 RepID=G3ARP4_SPAPN|nr:uncharacterized protein SPAPADRAFT_62389 [Spathaspora passalidarum NRRL Y-27907]EGW31797.1 hypothetical protein SPAPADRAFT_62389 [Spathaspora passalidarum NRRL Y-27907]